MRHLLLALTALSAPALAAPPKVPSAAAEAQVLELSKQAIALRSVQGEGNKTEAVAKLYKQALLVTVAVTTCSVRLVWVLLLQSRSSLPQAN